MKLFFFLVSLILLLVSVHSQPPKKPAPPTAAVMQYVLQWAPSFCGEQEKNPAAINKCEKPVAEEFTLHGLWPADAQGTSITNDVYECPPGNQDWNKLFTPIQDNLRKFWRQLLEKSTDRSLWEYQWRKHGACARNARAAAISSKDYFDTAITINGLFKQGNLIEYLKRNEIIACDSMSSTQIQVVEAVQKVFASNINVHVTCLRHNTTHDYLREVFLCTTLDGKSFTACPGTKNSCRDRIMLPHGQPKATTTVSVQEGQGETHGISYI